MSEIDCSANGQFFIIAVAIFRCLLKNFLFNYQMCLQKSLKVAFGLDFKLWGGWIGFAAWNIGIQRRVIANEAGYGRLRRTQAAATADVTHPAKQVLSNKSAF